MRCASRGIAIVCCDEGAGGYFVVLLCTRRCWMRGMYGSSCWPGPSGPECMRSELRAAALLPPGRARHCFRKWDNACTVQCGQKQSNSQAARQPMACARCAARCAPKMITSLSCHAESVAFKRTLPSIDRRTTWQLRAALERRWQVGHTRRGEQGGRSGKHKRRARCWQRGGRGDEGREGEGGFHRGADPATPGHPEAMIEPTQQL